MKEANIEVLALAAVNMRHEYNDADAADAIMLAVHELCYLRERVAYLDANRGNEKAVPLWQQDAKTACEALQARNDELTRRLNERTHR